MKKRTLIILITVTACIALVILWKKEVSYRKIKITTKIKANQLIKKRVDQTKTDGTYTVGDDFPEGEYVLVVMDTKKKTATSGSYTIYQDNSKKHVLDFCQINVNKKKLLKNEYLTKLHVSLKDLNEYASDLVSLKKEQLIELKNIKMYPATVREKFDTKKIIDGTYKVGRDIPEGSYTIKPYTTSDNERYTICITTNVTPNTNKKQSLIENWQNYTNQTYPKEITVEEGQYLSIDKLVFEKKD